MRATTPIVSSVRTTRTDAGSDSQRSSANNTAIAAAATATYLLMGPGPDGPRPAEPPRAVSESAGVAEAPPLDQIDADSRAAMRDFLRQSVQEDEQAREDSDW